METQNKDAEQKAAAGAGDKKAKKKVPALKVTCARDGFRRGGIAWSREPQTVKLSDLTKEQIEQIKNEKLLAVTEVEVEE